MDTKWNPESTFQVNSGWFLLCRYNLTLCPFRVTYRRTCRWGCRLKNLQSIKLSVKGLIFPGNTALFLDADGLFDGKQLRKFIHVLLFQLHRRVDITVQRDADIGMPQNLAEAFHVKSYLNTPGSKGVEKCIKMRIPDIRILLSCRLDL